MRWFKLSSDMPNDVKIGPLSDSEFRTWIELLCLAAKEEKQGDTGCNKGNIDWVTRRNALPDVTRLLHETLIYQNDAGNFVVKSWMKRQDVTKSSTERVRKYRALKRGNADETLCNENVTLTEETRLEESNKKVSTAEIGEGKVHPGNIQENLTEEFKLKSTEDDEKPNQPESPPASQTKPRQPGKDVSATYPKPEEISLEAWEEWLQMRKRRRAPNSKLALDDAVKQLVELKKRGFQPEAVVRQSILQGWLVFYAIKNQQNTGSRRQERDRSGIGNTVSD